MFIELMHFPDGEYKTYCILEGESKRTATDFIIEYSKLQKGTEVNGKEWCGEAGIKSSNEEKDIQKFISFMKKQGFKVLTTSRIYFTTD